MKHLPHSSTSKKSLHPWIETTKFEEMDSKLLLREILAKVKEKVNARIRHGGKPVKVVFDLDSTIFDVKPRSLRILKEFAATKEARAISSALCEWTKDLRAHRLVYTLEESALANNMPKDPRADEFMKEAFRFWRKRFFSDAYLLEDHPTAGAVDYAHAIVDAGAVAVYLTGRDWPGMGRGTQTMLRHWGFPIDHGAGELLMKPNAGIDDSEYKDSALRDLRIHSEAVAFFDNEPANFVVFEKNFPDAHLVFFYSNCSTKEASSVKKIYRIENFLM